MIPKLILFLLAVMFLAYLHHAMFYEKGSRFVRMVKRWPPGVWFHAFWGLVKVCLIAGFALWLGEPRIWWALLLWPVSDLWFRHWLNKLNGMAWHYMGNSPLDARAWFDLAMEFLVRSYGKRAPAVLAMTIEAALAGFAIFKLVQ